MGVSNDGKSYMIAGHWDPTDPSFKILNTETPKGEIPKATSPTPSVLTSAGPMA